MKDEQGRGAIRLGDQTSHGGKIVTANPTLTALGLPVALNGDMTVCPRCKGRFAILAPDSGNRHDGENVAFNGDPTACGARLISSL